MSDLIERVARALAASHGLNFDEVCGLEADPDNGECDSGTCISAHYEDHDADYARACYRADAQAAIAAIDLPGQREAAAKAALEAAAGAAMNTVLKASLSKQVWDDVRAIDPAAFRGDDDATGD